MLASSMAMQPCVNCSTLPTQKFALKKFSRESSVFMKLKPISPFRVTIPSHNIKISRTARNFRAPSAPAVTAEAIAVETSADDSTPPPPPESEKLGVVVKPMEKPRLVLKFIWMEKNIGLALDQVIPGHGTIPLSAYYFWPRKDAWEELKNMLEKKPWIPQKQVIVLLNQATDIINLWQQSGGELV